MIKDFGDVAKKLVSNPLGVIGLFIFLVYALAALVVGVTAENLTERERLLLIWFLILFPPFVFTGFMWLVTRHHLKQYAPGDFADPADFPGLDRRGQIERIDHKLQLDQVAATKEQPLYKQIGRGRGNTGKEQLRARYVLAESLVMKELSAEFGTDIRQHVALGPGVAVDGLFVAMNEAYAVEVEFWGYGQDKDRAIETVAQISQQASSSGWKRLNIVLAVVIDGSGFDAGVIVDELQRAAADPKIVLEVRTFVLSELLSRYGMSI